jgi:hypothetical protein
MAAVTIPILNPEKQLKFSIILDNQKVEFVFRWNLTGQYWTFELTGQTLTDEVHGAAVVSGADLLGPYAIRELGQLYCLDTKDLNEDPDFDNFGTRWVMVYVEKSGV